MQSCTPARVSHTFPPKATAVVTVRPRVWAPPPQDLVHVLHEPQSDSPQSTGHSCALHDWLSASGGHATPPKSTCVVTLRVRNCDPVPQDLVHVCHTPQSLTTQSTGQDTATLQVLVSESFPHATPAYCITFTTERERDCVPPAQDRVHVDQLPQSDWTQSIGQGAMAHCLV